MVVAPRARRCLWRPAQARPTRAVVRFRAGGYGILRTVRRTAVCTDRRSTGKRIVDCVEFPKGGDMIREIGQIRGLGHRPALSTVGLLACGALAGVLFCGVG